MLTPAAVNASTSSEGTVMLTGRASAAGTEVRLSSSDGVALVPGSITVPAGAVSGGQNAQGTIRPTGPWLAAMVFTVRTSSSLTTPPPTVTVPARGASATFTVTTRPVTLDTVFDIVAILADQARSAPIRLTP